MFDNAWLDSVTAVEAADPASLAAALFTLTDETIEELPLDQAEAMVLAAQRVVGAATARQRSAMETVARRCDERCERDAADAAATGARGHHPSGQAIAAGSLAALLHVSPRTMSTLIDQARRLVCALPQVHALAWSGDLEPYRVDAVVAESGAAPVARLHEFEARLLEGGITGLTCATLRRRARRTADRCAPTDSALVAELARERRDVRVRPGECTGMTRLVADLPTPMALRVWNAVDGLAAEYARAQPGLRMGAARADALTDLVGANATIRTTIELVAPIDSEHGSWPPGEVSIDCLGQTTGADVPARPVAQTAVAQADVPASAVAQAGMAQASQAQTGEAQAEEAPDTVDGPEGPVGGYEDLGGCEELDDGVLHDHEGRMWFVSSHTDVPLLGSLLPADVVALLADPDVTVRLARSDSVTGAIRWQDPQTYRPGAATARAVRSRDGTCRFPGCGTAAKRCQLDHVVRHPDGPTVVTNLQSLCATHHGFKHHAGWQVAMDALAVCTWTAPDGRTHTTWPMDRHGFRVAA